MANGFELYQRQRFAPSPDPIITIQRKGLLSLNRAAYDALGAPPAVELLYNRSDRLIGVRKAKQGADHAIDLRSRTGTAWTVSAKGFLRFYGIDVPAAVRRLARVKEGMLVIDLKERGVAATPGRQKA